ncbi:isochorismatase domain-containing protein 2 isoform X1 [Vombatus ursinus]|uniref:isochorismatase domain-containing protein 2 isoform X1 n=1 Tax=Vombatus ursinus TaxID=29139 RepID=UPI000FFD93A1|nr:isochorismatase domain-containing protein 2 isoform X1 [Vombatus ursinus]XP_027715801.1 isochorismatase domain-containing protein 2 isoform X1 [Vombatus ursinus]
MATARPALGRVLPGSSMLFLCDMQEKFRGTISFFPQIVAVSARMLQVARMLDIPVMLTEQYPTGLGPTVPELGAQDIRAVPKTCFSMVVPEVERLMNARPSLRSVLLCGIEAQACIMSTALDLLERGLDVHVVADACSSRRPSTVPGTQHRCWGNSSDRACSHTPSPISQSQRLEPRSPSLVPLDLPPWERREISKHDPPLPPTALPLPVRWTGCWLCPGCARAGPSSPPASASYCSWCAILPIRASRRCRN